MYSAGFGSKGLTLIFFKKSLNLMENQRLAGRARCASFVAVSFLNAKQI